MATDLAALAERVWYAGDRRATLARAALTPLAVLYGAVARARGTLYDRGVLHTHALALPAISVGNVTVGGTGKTPVAAWIASRLAAAGARPAIVLRGYGEDEPLVHAHLAPDARIVVDADRVRGVAAAARDGADVAVLDDAFQHRRARRDVDVVLVSAERAAMGARVLPAGPYREPLAALRRATVIVVTRKSAADAVLDAALARVAAVAPGVPRAALSLRLDEVRPWDAGDAPSAARAEPVGALDGARVVAVAAIGEPATFFAQLRAVGAQLTAMPYADHHAFTPTDVAEIARRAAGHARVVCTLKDAVKLGPLWPRLAPALWYVSQRVAVERGGDVLDHVLARLLSARGLPSETSGSGRPS